MNTPNNKITPAFVKLLQFDDEIADLRAAKNEVVAELKSEGYEPAAIRAVIRDVKTRRADPKKYDHLQQLKQTYADEAGEDLY